MRVWVRDVVADDASYRDRIVRLIDGIVPASRLVVHGRPDLAEEIGAGVHFAARAAAVISPPGRWVSRAVHDHDELIRAEASGATTLVVGTVFETPSKPGRETLGVGGLGRLCRQANRPVYAIGGIDETNARAVVEAGAHGVAVCGAIMGAEEPAAVAARIAGIVGSTASSG